MIVVGRPALAAALTFSIACSASVPTPPVRPAPTRATVVVVPTSFGSARVEIAIAYEYKLGVRATIPITIRATRGTIAGPLAARVVAAGFGEHGTPSEVLVRNLMTEPAIVVRAGEARATEVSWDGRDEKGIVVPADAYVLVVDFQIDDGGRSTRANAAAAFQWNE